MGRGRVVREEGVSYGEGVCDAEGDAHAVVVSGGCGWWWWGREVVWGDEFGGGDALAGAGVGGEQRGDELVDGGFGFFGAGVFTRCGGREAPGGLGASHGGIGMVGQGCLGCLC